MKSCSGKAVFCLNIFGKAGKQLLCQLVRYVESRFEHLVGERLQQLTCTYRLCLVYLQILLFHLALPLCRLGFETRVCALNERSIAIKIDHSQCLHLTELPIGRVCTRTVGTLRVRLGVRRYPLIQWQEYPQHSHSHSHIIDTPDSLRQLRTYV